MSQDRSELLQARLDQNYRDYLAQLREKPFDEIIKEALIKASKSQANKRR